MLISYIIIGFRTLIKAFIIKHQKGYCFNYTRPYIPFNLKLLLKTTKGCRDYYLLFNETENPAVLVCRAKWSKILNLETNDDDTWTKVYKCCFKSVSDNQLIWFQYKVLIF